LPHGLYSSNPESLAFCRFALQQRVLAAVAVELPQLSAHLRGLDLDTNLFLPRWLSCLFVTTLPAQAVLRLWDFLLAAEPYPSSSKDAGTVLLRLTLALLARAEEALLSAEDVEQALEALSSTVQGVTAGDVETMLVREWTVERFVRSSTEATHDGGGGDSDGEIPSEAGAAEDAAGRESCAPSRDPHRRGQAAAEVAKGEALEETSTNASTSPCEADGSSECAAHSDAKMQSTTFLSDESGQLRGCIAAA